MPNKDFEWTKNNIIKAKQNKNINKLEELDNNGHSALARAALAFPELIPELLDTGININQKVAYKKTAIMLACGHNPESFKILINYPNIDLSIQNSFEETVLMNSIEISSKNTKAILKHRNININAQDDFGETALMRACEISPQTIPDFCQHPEINFDIKNYKGNKALDVAKNLDNGSYELLQQGILKYITLHKENKEKNITNNKKTKNKILL